VDRSGVDAARRVHLSFPATMAGFEQAFGALQRELDRDELNPGTRYSIELVFEEIVANIVRHGSGGGGVSGVEVAVDVDVGGAAVVMTFDDGGVPFNPVGRPDPKRATSIEETPIGGLGLMMVRKAASEMRYERTPQQRNRLVVTLPSAPPAAG
jgi:anti-sigma regulatory factor (Ser/Thr protein kinase)